MKRTLLTAVLLVALTGCKQLEIQTGKPCAEVEAAIREYYVAKYPSFAELTSLRQQQPTMKRLLRSQELHRISPVSKIINSFPHGPYINFVERTELPKGRASVLSLDLYVNDDKTCRVVVRVDKRKKQDGMPFAAGKPITEEDIRKIMR